MPDTIRDGTGTGELVKVGDSNRLHVRSKNLPLQHAVSEDDQLAFQVSGTASLSSGTTTVLHLTNESPSKNIVVTYIRFQILDESGGTAIPNASNYFQVSHGRSYSSGETEIEPRNVFVGSGVVSNVLSHTDSPTLSGTAVELDRWYPKAAGEMYRYNKEGALIIPPSKELELSFIGDQTGGTIYGRISYIMESETD